MIPKSGNRFSDKIMLKQNVIIATVRVAAGVLIILLLAGCAGGSFGNSAPAAPTPDTTMAGRWILTAPGAPSCGVNFGGAPGARTGKVSPEGGCPANFYLSRNWALEQDALVINDDENNPLAQLKFAGARFEGQSTAGTPVTLARQTVPAN
jgi:hypothetical protein